MSPKLRAKINKQNQIPLLSHLVKEGESTDLLKIMGELEIMQGPGGMAHTVKLLNTRI